MINPVAFRIGPVVVHWYGIAAALAMISGYLVARRFVLAYGIDVDRFDALMIVFIPTIILGARAGYVIARWDYFRENPLDIIKIHQGGLGSHGAIIAMLVVGWISTQRAGVPFWLLADAVAPAIPLAHVFIRVGNFINGELYGLPTSLPWGVVFPGTVVPHHPSMLYEGLVSVFTFAYSYRLAAGRLSGRHAREGTVFLKTMLVVSLVRLLVDFTRDRAGGLMFGLMLTQILALAFGLVCAVLLIVPEVRGTSRTR